MQVEISFIDENNMLVGKVYKFLDSDVKFFYKPNKNTEPGKKKHTARDSKEIPVLKTSARIEYSYVTKDISIPVVVITKFGLQVGNDGYQFLKEYDFEKMYLPIITEKNIGKLYDLPSNYKILSTYLLYYGWYYYIKNKIISFPNDEIFEKMRDIFDRDEELLKKFIISNINPIYKRKSGNYALSSTLREAKKDIKLPASKFSTRKIQELHNSLKKELEPHVLENIKKLEDELDIFLDILKTSKIRVDDEDVATIERLICKYKNVK